MLLRPNHSKKNRNTCPKKDNKAANLPLHRQSISPKITKKPFQTTLSQRVLPGLFVHLKNVFRPLRATCSYVCSFSVFFCACE